jgi:hypothetical protein
MARSDYGAMELLLREVREAEEAERRALQEEREEAERRRKAEAAAARAVADREAEPNQMGDSQQRTMGSVAAALERVQQARSQLDAAIKRSDYSESAVFLRELREAEDDLRQAQASMPSDRVAVERLQRAKARLQDALARSDYSAMEGLVREVRDAGQNVNPKEAPQGLGAEHIKSEVNRALERGDYDLAKGLLSRLGSTNGPMSPAHDASQVLDERQSRANSEVIAARSKLAAAQDQLQNSLMEQQLEATQQHVKEIETLHQAVQELEAKLGNTVTSRGSQEEQEAWVALQAHHEQEALKKRESLRRSQDRVPAAVDDPPVKRFGSVKELLGSPEQQLSSPRAATSKDDEWGRQRRLARMRPLAEGGNLRVVHGTGISLGLSDRVAVVVDGDGDVVNARSYPLVSIRSVSSRLDGSLLLKTEDSDGSKVSDAIYPEWFDMERLSLWFEDLERRRRQLLPDADGQHGLYHRSTELVDAAERSPALDPVAHRAKASESQTDREAQPATQSGKDTATPHTFDLASALPAGTDEAESEARSQRRARITQLQRPGAGGVREQQFEGRGITLALSQSELIIAYESGNVDNFELVAISAFRLAPDGGMEMTIHNSKIVTLKAAWFSDTVLSSLVSLISSRRTEALAEVAARDRALSEERLAKEEETQRARLQAGKAREDARAALQRRRLQKEIKRTSVGSNRQKACGVIAAAEAAAVVLYTTDNQGCLILTSSEVMIWLSDHVEYQRLPLREVESTGVGGAGALMTIVPRAHTAPLAVPVALFEIGELAGFFAKLGTLVQRRTAAELGASAAPAAVDSSETSLDRAGKQLPAASRVEQPLSEHPPHPSVEWESSGFDGSCVPSLKEQCDQVGRVFPMCLQPRCCGLPIPSGCELCADLLRRCEPCFPSPCRVSESSATLIELSARSELPMQLPSANAVESLSLPDQSLDDSPFQIDPNNAGSLLGADDTRRNGDNPKLGLAVAPPPDVSALRSSSVAVAEGSDPMPAHRPGFRTEKDPHQVLATRARSHDQYGPLLFESEVCKKSSESFESMLRGQCARQRE